MRQRKGFLLDCVMVLMAICGCDTIDCTLNNTVVMTCNFYQDGKEAQLNDTITVTAPHAQDVLVNRKQNASSLALPLSYFNSTDTLVLKVSGDGYTVTDTLWVEKTSYNHFESPDCPVNMFHDITAVRSTHLFITFFSILFTP